MNRQTPNDDPRAVFNSARSGAKRRGVEWQLTFNQWWHEWRPYWTRRGAEHLVMCRYGDAGPYATGNVRIDTRASNNVDAIMYGSRSPRSIAPRVAVLESFKGLSPEVQAIVDAGMARILAGIGRK